MKNLFAVGSFVLTVLSANAAFAEVCYTTENVSSSLTCDQNDSKSADFTTGCSFTPAKTIQVEVACPTRWVSVSGKKSHEEVCSAEGMTPTNIEGAVCASGENRPNIGTDAGSIRYPYGTWGGIGNNGSIIEYSPFTNFCWHPGQKHDYDGSDILTAYACK